MSLINELLSLINELLGLINEKRDRFDQIWRELLKLSELLPNGADKLSINCEACSPSRLSNWCGAHGRGFEPRVGRVFPAILLQNLGKNSHVHMPIQSWCEFKYVHVWDIYKFNFRNSPRRPIFKKRKNNAKVRQEEPRRPRKIKN